MFRACAVCCVLIALGCMLIVVCCVLFIDVCLFLCGVRAACRVLCVRRVCVFSFCELFVACGVWFVVRAVLYSVSCMLFVMLFVLCCDC